MLKFPMMVAATGILIALSGCGSTDTTRTATGAGSGAVAGAVVGGPIGAVVGGVGGAAAGASLDEGLDKKARDLRDDSAASSGPASRRGQQTAQREAAGAPALGSERIRELQQALNDRNDGSDISVDGRWGPDTRRALRQFQRSNDLRPTGQPDRNTMAALNLNGGQPENIGAGTSGRSTTGTQPAGSGQSGNPQNGMNQNGMNQNGTGQTGNQPQQ